MKYIALLLILTLPISGCATLGVLGTIKAAVCVIKIVKTVAGVVKVEKECEDSNGDETGSIADRA